jgi:hypothetical protein
MGSANVHGRGRFGPVDRSAQPVTIETQQRDPAPRGLFLNAPVFSTGAGRSPALPARKNEP